jgi:hypothetical protein
LVCDDYFARHSETIGDILFEGEPCATKPAAVAQIPFGYVRRAAIADNVFPIGDQLGVIPSFTGDGMCLALSSAMAAARAVLDGSCGSSLPVGLRCPSQAAVSLGFRDRRGLQARNSAPAREPGCGSLPAACHAARQDDAAQKRGRPRFGHASRVVSNRVEARIVLRGIAPD